VLDRNGLRPARYWVTKDQRVIFASEVGVLPIDPANIERKGRLQPGRVFLVDIEQGRIIDDEELKSTLASKAPYGQWLEEQQVSSTNSTRVPCSSRATLPLFVTRRTSASAKRTCA